MERASFLSKYSFNWELMSVMLGGKPSLDAEIYSGQQIDENEAKKFLTGYGLDPADKVSTAEIFGTLQESIQFIRRYFLKEGSPDGLDLRIPNSLYTVTDVKELFYMVGQGEASREEKYWAEIILKVIHTILHVDKDLRSNYFGEIQTQIFDRFYRYLHRDGQNRLFLGVEDDKFSVPLVNFETKSKKPRDSVIIKLLHKTENVAEELFDRVGVRFITENRLDTLRVIKFLTEHSVVIPHNIKPSRSLNTLFDMAKFQARHRNVIKMAMRNDLSEERVIQALNREAVDCFPELQSDARNEHSLKKYQSIQFTGRHLIKYRNPFLQEFYALKKLARESGEDNELAKRIQTMDTSLIARDVRFFYAFEVQIVDSESYRINTDGEASYKEYKKKQVNSARDRLFKKLIEYHGINQS